jgi:hypothetical protein
MVDDGAVAGGAEGLVRDVFCLVLWRWVGVVGMVVLAAIFWL